MSDKKGRKSEKSRVFSTPHSLEKKDRLLIENIASYLKNKYKIDDEQLKDAIVKKKAAVKVPVSVFSKRLSALETIVKYLKEDYNLNFKEISILLNRKYTTISNSYKNSLKKHPKRLKIKNLEYAVPVSILKNRKFSVLENIVFYLKNNFKLSFSQIAQLLKRDVKTIWTVNKRKEQKNA